MEKIKEVGSNFFVARRLVNKHTVLKFTTSVHSFVYVNSDVI